MKWGSWLVLIFFVLAGCNKNDDGPATADQQEREILAYLAQDTSIHASRHESGFYYFTLKDTITANSGNILSIHYRIWTLDSAVVDEHLQGDGAPIKLLRGSGTVYPVGLDEGLALMNKGDKFGFIFPSHLAYGNLSVNEVLPPHSIVLFEVEVVEIENAGHIFNADITAIEAYLGDKGYDQDIEHPVIEFASGLRMYDPDPDSLAPPVYGGNRVGINWEGFFLSGESVDEGYTGNNIFEFTVGEGKVIAGFDEGVRNMRLGETAVLILPSELAYGPSVTVIPASLAAVLEEEEIIPTYGVKIPPFTPLVFEVRLRTIE